MPQRDGRTDTNAISISRSACYSAYAIKQTAAATAFLTLRTKLSGAV